MVATIFDSSLRPKLNANRYVLLYLKMTDWAEKWYDQDEMLLEWKKYVIYNDAEPGKKFDII